VEVVVAQRLLDRRVSDMPRTPSVNRGTAALNFARMTAQFFEAIGPVLPLPPKIRA